MAVNILEDDINRDHKLFKISSNHYLNIKGVELIFHEFKEIIIELALKIKGRQVEEGGKLKVRAMLKKFIDESIIINEGIQLTTQLPPWFWPVSYKNLSKKLQDEKKAKEEAEKYKKEKDKQDKEIALMSKEDKDAPESE